MIEQEIGDVFTLLDPAVLVIIALIFLATLALILDYMRKEKKKIRIRFEGSQNRHKEKDKKIKILMTENEHLKKENARLREELRKYRPKKIIIAPTKDKKVEQK